MNTFINVPIGLDLKWVDVIRNVGLFDIVTDNVSGVMDVTVNEDNISFIYMNALGNLEIKSKGGVNCFLLIYASSLIRWVNGRFSGSAYCSGVVLIDCSLPFIVSFDGLVKYKAIAIPYCVYSSDVLTRIKLREKSLYFDVISSIFEHANVSNKNFINKVWSLIHLLPITSDELDVDSITTVIKVLNTHALDPSFSLDKAAKLLFFSKRKLHNFLVQNGTSYSKLIADYRINVLAEKIIQQKSMPIKTLCHQSGFNSLNTANLAFKRIKGMSLSEYRKSMGAIV